MSWQIINADCIEAMREMEAESVDAIVTDPPYELGFMGKGWDASGIANSVEMWTQALRVLKPGGHLLSFGGTRTYHRMVCAVEDAGFEIRDQIAWMFGSGFPKSLDVSKAIDKQDAVQERLDRAYEFQAWLRGHLTPQQVNEATGTDMGHHVTTHPTQPSVATADLFDRLRPLLPPVPERIEELVALRTVESQNMKARAVTGSRAGSTAPGFAGDRHRGGVPAEWDETAPHTPEAAQWQGWGTALKPAMEPVVVARKPLIGTVASNVLEHGTGAINVDGCRIDSGADYHELDVTQGATEHVTIGPRSEPSKFQPASGRWPANVVMDEEAGRVLDEMTGELTSSLRQPHHDIGRTQQACYGKPSGEQYASTYGDSGGASRFFYCAKTSSAERNAGLDGFEEREHRRYGEQGQGPMPQQTPRTAQVAANVHPTVKPIALMRWLVRMVTPPNGTILDPFNGSGSTGCAAVLENFNYIGIEREAEYVAIAEARIKWWSTHPEGVDMSEGLKADRERKKVADSGQMGMFGEAA